MNYLDTIKEATTFIKKQTNFQPEIGLILGSGLGSLADEIENPVKISFADVPHFKTSTVKGHEGQWVLGDLEGKKVMAMQGRLHFYEGYTMQDITFPVRIMQLMGIKTLVVTNACGAINPDMYPGALMFITDHINFTGDNPLIGENFDELGPRFPDMSSIYSKELVNLGQSVATSLDIETFKGIYTAVSGPYYFSKAELGMVRNFGSDTIGMSTVPEAIVASHAGMNVLGISCITDMAIPEELESLTHDHVVQVANKLRPTFIRLVRGILDKMSVTVDG